MWGHVENSQSFSMISKNTPCPKQGCSQCQRYLAFCLLGRVQGMQNSKNTSVISGTASFSGFPLRSTSGLGIAQHQSQVPLPGLRSALQLRLPSRAPCGAAGSSACGRQGSEPSARFLGVSGTVLSYLTLDLTPYQQ